MSFLQKDHTSLPGKSVSDVRRQLIIQPMHPCTGGRTSPSLAKVSRRLHWSSSRKDSNGGDTCTQQVARGLYDKRQYR